MPFHQKDTIRYHTFELLDDAGVPHASISRQGGVSPEPWASLNLGGTVGDERPRVLENHRRAFRALSRPFESRYDAWQVHGVEVVCADAPRPIDQPHARADAILTDAPEVTVFMRFADCVPIFLYDPVRQVVGLVHAGWKGTVNQAARVAVQTMVERYRSQPRDILAGIGPSIGPHHYEVGPEVVELVRKAFGADASGLLLGANGSGAKSAVKFDLWNANRLSLEAAGVRQIEVAEICTACHPDMWYSHRGENGKTGRFGALIGLSR
ncbi:MAG: peptidoglycan editing factor PgeF [Anaerolineae bacterium]|jgi:YfiH family protein|nr:peptidoglycan editing factor PgeF [Anaerolineae bacterium]MCZ7553258.1 peptidoglycan editing factor PgeF [Anaerolineales bacterium]